jgi:hypothetical protein
MSRAPFFDALCGSLRCASSNSQLNAVPRQNSDLLSNQADEFIIRLGQSGRKTGRMIRLRKLLAAQAAQFPQSRRDQLLENLAPRQQLAVLKRPHPPPRFAPLTDCSGPCCGSFDRTENGHRSSPDERPLPSDIGQGSSCVGPGSRGIEAGSKKKYAKSRVVPVGPVNLITSKIPQETRIEPRPM